MSLNSSQIVKSTKSYEEVNIDAIKHVLSIILYTLTIVLGIIGNSMVIWVGGFKLKFNQDNGARITNLWLVNLALADLIFCFTRISSLIKLFFDHWPFGIFVCKFNGFFKYANMFCSVFLLSVISLDRALCVWKPVFTKKNRTLLVARGVAIVVWALAFVFSAPYFIYRQVYLGKNNFTVCSLDGLEGREGDNSAKIALYSIRFICGFLLPFLVIITCSILAAFGIKRLPKFRKSHKSRTLKRLVILAVAFFLCWTPYHCLLLVKIVDSQNMLVKIWHPIVSGVAYFHSCVNPILYYCMGMSGQRRVKPSLESAVNSRRQRSKEQVGNSEV